MLILFVCYGNICRSPMAEAFMRGAIAKRPALRGFEVGSMGVRARAGRAAAENTLDVLHANYSLDLKEHRSRQLQLPVEADLILTMDRLTTALVLELGVPCEVVMLGDYAGSGEEVSDPYGHDREVYCACAEHIANLVELAAFRLETQAHYANR